MGLLLGVLAKKKSSDPIDWINCRFNTNTQLNDESGNNRQFTQQNGGLTVTTTNDPSGALRFDGSGYLVTQDSKPLLDKDFNISCEVFIEAGSDFYSNFLAQRITFTDTDTEFYSLQDGRLLVVIYFSDNSGYAFTGVAIRNQWQSVEMSRVGNIFTLKVDGVVAETQVFNKTVRNTSNGKFNIGSANQAFASGTPTGSMRNLKIYIAD